MTNSTAARTNLTFKDVDIKTNEKIGEGSFRECYEGIYIGGHRNQQDAACKRFKTQHADISEDFYPTEKTTAEALSMAESWNEICDKNKKILISTGSVYVSPVDGLTYLIEPLIRDCIKFNSNTGWVADNAKEWQVRCMEAFSHFTFHQSGGQLVVCDLQGRYRKDKFKKAKCRFELCCDPVICSRNRSFGPTDLGEKGIHAFFATHTCNEFCQPTWSRPKTLLKRSFFPITRGTALVSLQVTDPMLTLKNPAGFRLGSNGLLEISEEEEKENKVATVANRSTTGSKNKNSKKTNKKKNKGNAFEVVGEHNDQVVGEMGDSGSDWGSNDDGNNSGSDWSDDDGDDNDKEDYEVTNDENKGYDDSGEYEVAGDISNDYEIQNDSYDVYGDDYGSEYGDAGETTDEFFIGNNGIGTDDEKIVGEQSGDDNSDFDEGNKDGENAIIFC